MPTFDAAAVTVTVNGIPLTGFGEGSKVHAEREADAYSKVIGTDGDGARAKSNNKSGTITVTLLQTSRSNLMLEQIADLDEYFKGGAGLCTVDVFDTLGGTLAHASEAWIRRKPAVEAKSTVSEREWIFETLALDPFVLAGNL